jgi:hypothetical protein
MSDHDAAPDPIDKAYAQAEAVLSDDSARAARRARVLAAVAREPATPSTVSSPLTLRRAWRRGGWLAAASVAGLGLLLATQLYLPAPIHRQPLPATSAAPSTAAPETATSPAPGARAPSLTPKPGRPSAADRRAATPSPHDVPAVAASPAPPPQVAEPFAAALAPAPSEGRPAVAVTAQRRAEAPAAIPRARLSGDAAAEAADSARATAKPTPDPAARLRAAAAAGRTEELAALLADGVPVDAPDADGETALMRSIRADRPAAAALLRRRGASLDRENHAGDSARDMARMIDDPELDQALGLAP